MQSIKFELKFFLLIILFSYGACIETVTNEVSNEAEAISLEMVEEESKVIDSLLVENNVEAAEITDSLLIEQNMIGTWKIGGIASYPDGSVIFFDGMIEFDSIYYTGRVSMEIRRNQQTVATVNCEANDKWVEKGLSGSTIAADYQGSCDCTFKIVAEEKYTKQQLVDLKKGYQDIKPCKDGAPIFSDDKRDNDDVFYESKFYKDQIFISVGRHTEPSLITIAMHRMRGFSYKKLIQ